MKSKYIIIDNGLAEEIIVFPEYLQHDYVAQGFSDIVSAGFIEKVGGKFFCYGKGTSLNILSRFEDTVLASKQLKDLL
jgi:hypothetical protein